MLPTLEKFQSKYLNIIITWSIPRFLKEKKSYKKYFMLTTSRNYLSYLDIRKIILNSVEVIFIDHII